MAKHPKQYNDYPGWPVGASDSYVSIRRRNIGELSAQSSKRAAYASTDSGTVG
jgi:hypothetical protein